jgi:hypothetical protein
MLIRILLLVSVGILLFTAMSAPALGPMQPPVEWILRTFHGDEATRM